MIKRSNSSHWRTTLFLAFNYCLFFERRCQQVGKPASYSGVSGFKITARISDVMDEIFCTFHIVSGTCSYSTAVTRQPSYLSSTLLLDKSFRFFDFKYCGCSVLLHTLCIAHNVRSVALHNCSRYGMAAARLPSERPGNVTPLSKTFTFIELRL